MPDNGQQWIPGRSKRAWKAQTIALQDFILSFQGFVYDRHLELQQVSLCLLTLKAFFIHELSQPISEALRTSGPHNMLRPRIAWLKHTAALKTCLLFVLNLPPNGFMAHSTASVKKQYRKTLSCWLFPSYSEFYCYLLNRRSSFSTLQTHTLLLLVKKSHKEGNRHLSTNMALKNTLS